MAAGLDRLVSYIRYHEGSHHYAYGSGGTNGYRVWELGCLRLTEYGRVAGDVGQPGWLAVGVYGCETFRYNGRWDRRAQGVMELAVSVLREVPRGRRDGDGG